MAGDPQNAFYARGATREQKELLGYVQSLLPSAARASALRSGNLWHLGFG